MDIINMSIDEMIAYALVHALEQTFPEWEVSSVIGEVLCLFAEPPAPTQRALRVVIHETRLTLDEWNPAAPATPCVKLLGIDYAHPKLEEKIAQAVEAWSGQPFPLSWLDYLDRLPLCQSAASAAAGTPEPVSRR